MKLIHECKWYPEISQNYFKQYFEKDTAELYNFYNLDLTEVQVVRDGASLKCSQMEFEIPARLQALKGNTHGGCISFIFDAFMGVGLGFPRLMPEGALMQAREISSIEIFAPVPTEEKLLIRAEIEREAEGRKFWTRSQILNRDETRILAAATGFFLRSDVANFLD
jgi:acyl-coenzyme A thioesterase PaaI-like protein